MSLSFPIKINNINVLNSNIEQRIASSACGACPITGRFAASYQKGSMAECAALFGRTQEHISR